MTDYVSKEISERVRVLAIHKPTTQVGDGASGESYRQMTFKGTFNG